MVIKDKEKPVNHIGMFDIFKGIGMLMVVFGHTVTTLFSNMSETYVLVILKLLFSLLGAALIPAFFIVSGYGFRKRPVGKCIRQQVSLLLKPYCLVAAATVFLHLIIHYLAFGYWPASVRETVKVAGGFLLALPQNRKIFGISFFWCGAVWYIMALLIGWVCLDVLMNTVSEKYLTAAVILTAAAGWAIGNGRDLPFCLSQGLIAVGLIYTGYRIRKDRIFLKEKKWYGRLLIFLACVLSAALTVWSRKTDNMNAGIWTAGPFSILIDTVMGVGVLALVLKLNRYENPLLRLLQMIGRDSLLIFCIHTVEMIAVPWYLLREKYEPVFCDLLILVLRWGLILCAIRAIKYVIHVIRGRKLRKQWKRSSSGK